MYICSGWIAQLQDTVEDKIAGETIGCIRFTVIHEC